MTEVTRMPGKGGVRVTGSLGPVLTEAAHTAVSYVRSHSAALHLPDDWIKQVDLHLHIPRARAAQDFAGMGVSIFAAVCSLLLGVRCRPDPATIGELTLRGSVLPVRGIQAMLLAAHRAGIREVLVPARNEPDVAEVPREVTSHLQIRYITKMEEVLALVLAPPSDGHSQVALDPLALS